LHSGNNPAVSFDWTARVHKARRRGVGMGCEPQFQQKADFSEAEQKNGTAGSVHRRCHDSHSAQEKERGAQTGSSVRGGRDGGHSDVAGVHLRDLQCEDHAAR